MKFLMILILIITIGYSEEVIKLEFKNTIDRSKPIPINGQNSELEKQRKRYPYYLQCMKALGYKKTGLMNSECNRYAQITVMIKDIEAKQKED